jgi:hypothetical protein
VHLLHVNGQYAINKAMFGFVHASGIVLITYAQLLSPAKAEVTISS